MKAQIDKLVEEEMRSDTEVERNDFKTAVETFAKQMKIVTQEIEDSVQSQKAKAAKSLAATCLGNSLVFQLDDEPIPGVDTLSGFTTSSIALESRSQKQKRDITDSIKPSTDIVLMNSGSKEIAVAFTNTYYSNINMQNTKLVSLVGQVEKRMDLVENSLGEIKGSLGDMKSTLGNI